MVGPRQLLVLFGLLVGAPRAALAAERAPGPAAIEVEDARLLLTRAPAPGLGLDAAPRLDAPGARGRLGLSRLGTGRALPPLRPTADGGAPMSGVMLASSAACAAASVSGLFVASWLRASYRSEADDALADDLRRRNQVVGATSYGLGAAAIGLGVGAFVAGKW